RHALTGACNPVHAADGGRRVTRSRLVRFERRAPSPSANDAAGDQPTGGYPSVLSLRPRAVSASGLEMSGLDTPLRTAKPMPTRATIGHMPPANRARAPSLRNKFCGTTQRLIHSRLAPNAR